jgi:PAS domain S-box-containing protein
MQSSPSTPAPWPDIALSAHDLADTPLPIAEVVLDTGTFVAANAAAARLYGATAVNLIGRTLAQYALQPHAGSELAAHAIAAQPFVLHHRRPDGSPWVAEVHPIRLQPGPPPRLLFTLQDVTTRWRTDQALQVLDRHPDLSARISRACAWEIWPAEERIFCDARLPGMFGYTAQELGPRLADWNATVPEADRPRIAAALQAVIEGRCDHYAVEHPVRRKDGTAGWVHVHGTRVGAPGETPLRIVGASVDITERKRFERVLELTQFAIDHSPHAAFWIDGRGCVTRTNEQAARSLGQAAEALLGQPVWSFDPDFTPAAWAPLLERMQRDGSVVFETRHRRADGSVFAVEITASHIPFEGQFYGFCVARDISERQRAEQVQRELATSLEQRVQERTAELDRQSRRNELILGGANDGFFASDELGRLRDVNPAFCRLLGYTREELLQRTIADIEAVEDAPAVAAHIHKLRALGHDRFDTWHRRRDGSGVEVEVSVSRVWLAGEPMLFAFVRDITERQATHRLLQVAKEEAERANLAKSEFLSRMSHELRTPLNAILGFGQLLSLKTGEPTQAGQLREILNAGAHLLTLIDDVLDLARVESGHLAVSLEPVALRPLLDECLNLVRPQAQMQAPTPGITLPQQAACAGLHVRADRTRLKQVLLNLLSNAIKYNRPGGSVTLRCEAAADGTLRVCVDDSGPGLTPAQQARLFVPFERLDAEARRIQGTGIGLALSRRLVEAMGGTLGVESAPGVGSSFWLRLPQARPQAEGPAVAVAAEAASGPVASGTHQVLCIEDNPANLRLIEGIFVRRPQLRLLTAIAPGLGLELARTHRPELILLDINLPDLDGYAVLQHLRADAATRDIPVIAVSANAMPHDVERARAAGFIAYLTKPLDIAQLLRLVDDALATNRR